MLMSMDCILERTCEIALLDAYDFSCTGPWTGIGLALSNNDGPSFEGVPITFNRKKVAPQS